MKKIIYEDWNCRGIWVDINNHEQMPLCIKKYNGGIIVALEDGVEGNLHNSTSYAESQYMEAFSDFMNRLER